MNKSTVLILVFLAALISTVAHSNGDAQAERKVPISKSVYYLHHRLIPDWLFNSEGAFFSDMQNGVLDELISEASLIVSPEYAGQITISPIAGHQSVLITFPKPEVPPNCFYALLIKTPTGFQYITYERTEDVTNSGITGVVGGWDLEGHNSYGPRFYTSATDFVNDILGAN